MEQSSVKLEGISKDGKKDLLETDDNVELKIELIDNISRMLDTKEYHDKQDKQGKSDNIESRMAEIEYEEWQKDVKNNLDKLNGPEGKCGEGEEKIKKKAIEFLEDENNNLRIKKETLRNKVKSDEEDYYSLCYSMAIEIEKSIKENEDYIRRLEGSNAEETKIIAALGGGKEDK